MLFGVPTREPLFRLMTEAATDPACGLLAPDTPTIAEYKLDKQQLVVWFALFAPDKTPPEIIEKVNKTVNQVLKTDKLKQLSLQIGMTPADGSAQDLRKYQESEIRKWHDLVETTGVKIN